MISKVLDKDTLLAKKIWMLFREQGITITSILTAIVIAVSILVKALLPSNGGQQLKERVVAMTNQRMQKNG